MDETNPNPRMTRFAVSTGLLGDVFTLIDVGCSGGIHGHWRVFGSQLRAFGFDPQRQECARLNQAESNPQVRYFPYFVGLEPDHWFHQQRKTQDPVRLQYFRVPFTRFSAGLALECSDAVRSQSNPLNEDLTTDRISVSRFVQEHAVQDVDFIKTDTDGGDLEAVISCEDLIRSGSVLGFLVESPFTGSDHPTSNTFHNIDRYMRQHGYSLFSLWMHRYSRRALPSRFRYTIAAQTEAGQAIWGDALYFRDPAAPQFEALWGKLPFEKLLKLACLYEVFNLNDCAAELIQHHRENFAKETDPDRLLDLLTPTVDGAACSYADYMRVFRSDVSRFFPAQPAPPRSSWRHRSVSSILRGIVRRAKRVLSR